MMLTDCMHLPATATGDITPRAADQSLLKASIFSVQIRLSRSVIGFVLRSNDQLRSLRRFGWVRRRPFIASENQSDRLNKQNPSHSGNHGRPVLTWRTISDIYRLCHFYDFLFLRLPGTVVAGGLMFYCWCSFFSTLRNYISELPRPIAVKLSQMIGSVCTWTMVPKLGDLPQSNLGCSWFRGEISDSPLCRSPWNWWTLVH